MKINIIGDGSFGTFLHGLLSPLFEIEDAAESVILAVPISAYESLAAANSDKHIINVCSVQLPSTELILKHTGNVTCIHPLFGSRTPEDKRNAIVSRTIAGTTDSDGRFCLG